jgi:putative hydrolase of the HAD superfamily
MLNKAIIKGVLIDYGGTIDTNGVHWGEVLWTAYVTYKIPVSKEAFRLAYTYGEKALAIKPLVKPEHNFLDVLTIKLGEQFSFLYDKGLLQKAGSYTIVIQEMAAYCNKFATTCIAAAKPVLEKMAVQYPLVMVSNFYGNIQSVLNAYGILHCFTKIIESSVVGYRKPDPQIYKLGVKALGIPAAACVVIGDSYTKDMEPGKLAGCKTIWLKGEGWESDPVAPVYADTIIKSFAELEGILGLNVT